MNDYISRQGAIDAFTDEILVTGRSNAKSVVKAYVKLVVDRIKRLPSAQPEKRTEERTETHACDLIERQAMNDDKMKIGDEVAFHWNDGRPDTVVVITHIGYDGFIDGMDAKGTLYASKNPQKWTKTGRYFPLVTHLLRQMSGDKLPSAQQWIPCSETVDIPEHEVLCCDKYGEELIGWLSCEDDQWLCESEVEIMYDPVAWMEKPKPWKGEQP